MLIAGSILITLFSKGYILIWLNDLHDPVPDFLFIVVTKLGNGLLFILIIVFLLAFSFRNGISGAFIFIITGGLVQILKRAIDQPRPLGHYGDLSNFNLIEGVALHSSYSFPSGHAATAFAMCCLLALVINKKGYSILLFIIAFLIAISRVYVMQHFFIDILFGSLIGVVVAHWVYFFMQKPSIFDRFIWIDAGLINHPQK